MRQTGVGEVEGSIELIGCHGWIGRIDHRIYPIHLLQQALRMVFVRLLFNMSVVLGLRSLVTQTLLMGVQHDIVVGDSSGNVFFLGQIDGLGKVM